MAPDTPVPTQRPRAPRLPAAERRDAIIDAAATLFGERGYHATSTADIARACGCSEPVLYKHFEGKRELFRAVLERKAATARNAMDGLDEADDPLAYVLAFAERMHGQGSLHSVMRLRLQALSIIDEPGMRETLASVSGIMRGNVERAVRLAQARGTARPDVDPEQLAWLWWSVVNGTPIRHVLHGPDHTPDAPTLLRALVALARPPEEARAL